jgi:tight adherence protein B
MNPAAEALIYVLAFIAVVLLAQSLAGALFATSDRTRRTNRRLAMLDAGLSREQVYAALVRKPASGAAAGGTAGSVLDQMALRLRQAGLSISPLRLILVVVSCASVLWLISLGLLHSASGVGRVANAAFALVGALVLCAAAAWFWVDGRRTARLKLLEDQLPLALDVITRALRAGHPVISAVQLAADELGDPIGTEFGLVVDETTYGYDFKDALTNLAVRTGSPDAHFFAVSVGIQSETGGNLSEILSGLASVIRARGTLAKRVKALASEGRASALILSALPLLLVSFFAMVQPHFYTDKFSDPIFWPVVGFVLALYGIGWVMIYRIINFKY